MNTYSINARRLALAALVAALALSAAAAQGEGALRGLSASERERLAKGETLIRTVADYRSLALAEAGAEADVLRSSVAALKPNYATEVMASFPAADEGTAAALLEKLAVSLSDPKGYVGIPFFSKRHQRTFDLFDRIAVESRKRIPGGEEIAARQHMEPFDEFEARYEYRLADSRQSLTFSAKNLEPIIYSYQKFKAVAPGAMLWSLYAFRDGDRLVFYGVGAVKAFDLFGAFRDRLEPSFMGRVEAFFGYMCKKMGESTI